MKQTNGNIALDGKHLKLPKLGWIRFAKSREVHGRILIVAINSKKLNLKFGV